MEGRCLWCLPSFPLMKLLALLAALATLASGCNLFNDDDYVPKRPRHFPDGTPFIVGILEATPDTAAFYGPPEAFVGTIIDPMNGAFLPEQDPAFLVDNAIWSPTLYGQVVKLANQVHFLPVPDNGATVTMTGPLGQAAERTVALQLKNHGVYADLRGQLEVVAGAQYRMDVIRSDGKRYTASGDMPSMPRWDVADTTLVSPRLNQHPTGFTEIGSVPLGGWTLSEDANITVTQTNYENDSEVWSLEQEETFFHWQRGNYRRDGSQYAIHMKDREPDFSTFGLAWGNNCSGPIRASTRAWIRLSQIGEKLGNFYSNEFDHTATVSDDGIEQFKRRLWGNDGFGREYADWLFSRGNIESLDGGLRPFGVFGGYSSIYRTTVLKPVRTYEIPADWSCRR